METYLNIKKLGYQPHPEIRVIYNRKKRKEKSGEERVSKKAGMKREQNMPRNKMSPLHIGE